MSHRRRLTSFVSAALLAACLTPGRAQGTPAPDGHTETKAQRDARMHWWREARFGMFIHWGLYAVPAGVWNGKPTGGAGEWIMHDQQIPVADYAALAPRFNPTQFNADAWVRTARDAGMKYIVMTAKHHEGFAMYPSQVDGYNIHDATPFKRDPIGEMAAACRKYGLKFGVYYSQAQDWHHPGGAAYGGHWDKAQDGDLHEYVYRIAAPQVAELITRYHPAVLWWDTAVDMSANDLTRLTASFSQDPGLIMNNRLGNGIPGDTETPEQTIPATGFPGRDWETCMTINDTWGYKSNDTDFKSSETLLRNLIDIASKGGNYLLNVGPDATGVIPAPEVERLRVLGGWLKANGEAIYGTTHSPFKRLSFDGRCTQKGDTLYLHVFTWPEGGLSLAGLKTPIRDARTLVGGQRLTVQTQPDGTVNISRPTRIDPLATVITLQLSGPPTVDTTPLAVSPQTDGRYVLKAEDADLHGDTVQVENRGGAPNIGFWTTAQDTVSWPLTVSAAAAGAYRVELEYACPESNAGATYALTLEGDVPQSLTGQVGATGAWDTFQTQALDGTLTLSAGTATLRVVPKDMPHGAVMNLRRIVLTPVGAPK